MNYRYSPSPSGNGLWICNRCYAEVGETYQDMKEHDELFHPKYNTGADGKCNECGATVKSEDYDRHAKWHKEIKEAKDMSGVRWCDDGGHAFKAGEQGSASMNATVAGENGPEIIERDVCRQHNPFRVQPNVIAKELEAAYPVKTEEERQRSNPSAY